MPPPQVAVRLWHDQLFVKPPGTGGVVAWHQDYSYWTRAVPMQHLTVHVALEEQDEANGCIQYIPGSHAWTRDGAPLPVLDFDFKYLESIKSILTPEELAKFHPVPIRLKAGECVLHHPLAVHGSLANTSDRWRRAAVINYMADGTRWALWPRNMAQERLRRAPAQGGAGHPCRRQDPGTILPYSPPASHHLQLVHQPKHLNQILSKWST